MAKQHCFRSGWHWCSLVPAKMLTLQPFHMQSIQTFPLLEVSDKLSYLDALIARCGVSELNYIAGKLDAILRLDFLAQMPIEVQENIIGYLDADSLCRGRLVSHQWNKIISGSKSADIVFLNHLGAKQLSTGITSPHVKFLLHDVLISHLSLKRSIGVHKLHVEGHSGPICSLYYNEGLLASNSHDGTARITRVQSAGLRFERILQCIPSAAIKFDHLAFFAGQFDGNISMQSFNPDDMQNEVVFRGHSGPVHCFEFSRSRDLMISGGEDWKLITWKLSGPVLGRGLNAANDESRMIKSFSGHAYPVTELKMEEVTERPRPYASIGELIVYSKDKNYCHIWRTGPPYDWMQNVKSLTSVDGHTFKHGMIITSDGLLVVNTRLRVHIWDCSSLLLIRTVSCEHLSIPDLVGWGNRFGLLVDIFGLHVVDAHSGLVLYIISVASLRRLDRTYTRFIAGDVKWLDGFSGRDGDFSHMLYASAMSRSFQIQVTSWNPHVPAPTAAPQA